MAGWKVKVGAAALVGIPALALRVLGITLDPIVESIVFGAAIFAAAFLLTWAAEAAEADVSASVAVAALALIAILPEYAVDLYFAYTAGEQPHYAQYAAANMTGSNRLLIGMGWPVVVYAYVLSMRRKGKKVEGIRLGASRRLELGVLIIASVYAFSIPLKGSLGLVDSVFLLLLFAFYLWRLTREKKGEPEFTGVAAELAVLPTPARRSTVAGMFALAAIMILASAEPFAEGLVRTGAQLGIDEFLLVQWLAPLASEAPEFIVAVMLAWKLKSDSAMGTLLSSKVNQWTLLVGSLPLAYLAGGGGTALHLDARQVEEFVLTAAQTVLGIAVMLNLRLSWREATMLLGLFLLQFPFPETRVRLGFSLLYLLIAAVFFVRARDEIRPTVRALYTPSHENEPVSDATHD